MIMLYGKRQNTHHSKLPNPGAIGTIVGLERSGIDLRRKCIVVAFPLTDSPNPRYSLGIHTCWVRFLDNNEIARFSGIWFQEGE
jgi:hypothetical protein